MEKCQQCNDDSSLDIISISQDEIVKQCKNCRYSYSTRLPTLDKKVIYLDQFGFSELYKIGAGTRRPDKWTTFWSEADILLKQAVNLQRLVLPCSNIHHRETIVSPFSRQLKEMQDALSGDVQFISTLEIQLSQIEEFVRAYFTGEDPQVSFEIDKIIRGDRNAWLPRFRIIAQMNWSSFASATRDSRDRTYRDVKGLIEQWKRQESGFDEVLEIELGAYFASRYQALQQNLSRLECDNRDLELCETIKAAESLVSRELELINHYAIEAEVRSDALTTKAIEFWKWNKNREQPFGLICSYLLAALAAQFKAGRTKLPSPGFLNDINAIAAYAPYVDAMFVDNECAELLKHGRCRKDLNHKSEVFCLNDADKFLEFLKQIIDGTPADVRETVQALYGESSPK